MPTQLPATTISDPGARVLSLRSQYPDGLLGVPRAGLRLTWRAEAATPQLGFQVRWDDRAIEPAYVSFALDAQGQVDRITMQPVSPLADFSYDYQDLLFKPVAAPGK